MSMFCFQCEQTAKGTGCTNLGVCGKKPTTAALQDAIVRAVKEIGFYNGQLRAGGEKDATVNRLVLELLFATITNVDFDDERLTGLHRDAITIIERLRKLTGANLPADALCSAPGLREAGSTDALVRLAQETPHVSASSRKALLGEDLHSLQELLMYGLKGTAAYAHHAVLLGKESDEVYAFFAKALSALALGKATVEELISLNMECGLVNFKVMELLDAGHTERFGHPTPTPVRITPKQGKAILVSGHDLPDLEELLRQTEGKGINVYTHGEMLPAHGYPALRKYPHLAGNYGGAWQDQRKEFAEFPGAILMTTNCIQNPAGYEGRIFTTGCVAWPGVVHVADAPKKDFSPVIEAALAAPGFEADDAEKTILVGFGHEAVLGVAGAVVDAVKAGKIKRFFLIGGCDGAKSGRNYYTELAEKIPQDCVILTLACGKYRFNKREFGDIGGIPRLLDIGQCNDAYSAIQIALALAKAFECDVNALPLSIILSWYEQKAVCILLTLLALGIKGIKLGPSLPAFVSPGVLNVLVEKFAISPTTTADEDLRGVLV